LSHALISNKVLFEFPSQVIIILNFMQLCVLAQSNQVSLSGESCNNWWCYSGKVKRLWKSLGCICSVLLVHDLCHSVFWYVRCTVELMEERSFLHKQKMKPMNLC
jgi:hypothetical protein